MTTSPYLLYDFGFPTACRPGPVETFIICTLFSTSYKSKTNVICYAVELKKHVFFIIDLILIELLYLQMYLMKYGYMDSPQASAKTANLLSRDGLRDYIMDFQAFAGINMTGELDNQTVVLMNTPR